MLRAPVLYGNQGGGASPSVDRAPSGDRTRRAPEGANQSVCHRGTYLVREAEGMNRRPGEGAFETSRSKAKGERGWVSAGGHLVGRPKTRHPLLKTLPRSEKSNRPTQGRDRLP